MAVALAPKPGSFQQAKAAETAKTSSSSVFGYRCVYPFSSFGRQTFQGKPRKKIPQTDSHIRRLSDMQKGLVSQFDPFFKEAKQNHTEYYSEKSQELTPAALKLIKLNDPLAKSTFEMLTAFAEHLPPSSMSAPHHFQLRARKAKHIPPQNTTDERPTLAYNIVWACSIQSLHLANIATSLERCLPTLLTNPTDKVLLLLDDMQELCLRSAALSEAALLYHPYARQDYIRESIESLKQNCLEVNALKDIHQQSLEILFETAVRLYHNTRPVIPGGEPRAPNQQELIEKLADPTGKYISRLSEICSPAFDFVDRSPCLLILRATCNILLQNMDDFEKSITALSIDHENFNPTFGGLLRRVEFIEPPGQNRLHISYDYQLIKMMPDILDQAFESHAGNFQKQKQITEQFTRSLGHFKKWWKQLDKGVKDLPAESHHLYKLSLALCEVCIQRCQPCLDVQSTEAKTRQLSLECDELMEKANRNATMNWDIKTSLARIKHSKNPKAKGERDAIQSSTGQSANSGDELEGQAQANSEPEKHILETILEPLVSNQEESRKKVAKRLEKISADEQQPLLMKTWATLYLGNVAVIPCTRALANCLQAQKIIFKYGEALDQCDEGSLPSPELYGPFREACGKFSDACYCLVQALEQASKHYETVYQAMSSNPELKANIELMDEVKAVFHAKHTEMLELISMKEKVHEILRKKKDRMKDLGIKGSQNPGERKKRSQVFQNAVQRSELLSQSFQRFQKVRSQHNLFEQPKSQSVTSHTAP